MKVDFNPFAGAKMPDMKPAGGKKPRMGRTAAIVAAVAVVAVLGFNSVYSINEQENAVVTTLGSPQAVTTPGLHFKIPFIQQVRRVDMTIKGLGIGYVPGTAESIPDESLMITSDYNFVNVDFFVEYRVTDPVKFLYSSQQPEMILKTLAQSYIRDTIGMYPVDEIITTGKSQIQSEIKEKIMARMEAEDVGVQLVNITIQDAEPPTAEVLTAFKEVETAKQGKETAVNNANKYRSEQLPAAEAQADQIVQQAEGERQARINEASGQVARFESMYAEYMQYPLITKQRMYYEAMEELLPGMKVVIQSEDGETLNMFNMDAAQG
ncbi:FtsH protease activity modulator HflK [Allofournierella sp.]|uniref:FtsH protease activity modulator HflK n=1 Tax=Allofournierella sp. TaxID=1940256 RepID=UPI003AB6AA0E